ncbi:MAG: dihydrolipoamide acetyltransferase family protein [Candidatus Dormiibacterota bacterium]
MALTVTMPQLGESVTEGTIARWLKQPGDAIAKYESIAEVITDKVNAEIPAPADGVMSELIAPEGTVVPVGQPICSIDTGAGAADAAPQATRQEPAAVAAKAESVEATPAAAPAPSPERQAGAESAVAPIQNAFTEKAADAPSESPAMHETGGGNGQAGGYHVTPAVRMLVREHGVDLSQITGSGIGGRISKKDVLEYVQRRDAGGGSSSAAHTPAEVPAPAPPLAMSPTQAPPPASSMSTGAPAPASAAPASFTGAAAPGEGETVVPLTQVRKAIAEHMVRSRQTSPHAYVMVEVDMSAVSRIRDREKAAFEARHGVKLTFLPFVARAVVEALQRHPTLNASWSDAGIVVKRAINLGIAVALEDNLIVPVVRDADRLSITGLATTMADLGARARSNHLKLDEIQGGTFTLNNTGALGAVMTQAIINQPQAAIMTMDMVVKRPVVVGDAIAIRPIMNLGLSFDHRINDGLQATRFVTAVQKLLEGLDPSATLV